MKRNDIHCPSNIIPANYQIVLSYALGQWHYGTNCEHDRAVRDEKGAVVSPGEHGQDGKCCLKALRESGVQFSEHGGAGNCSICGARYLYGDVWVHTPTGEHIHIGHTCADKYEMMADRSAFELELGRLKKAKAIQIQREQNAEARAEFLSAHPGLEEALKTEHHIVQDIAAKFITYRSLSDKQIALVMKLAQEAKNPPEKEEEEKQIPAPITGERQTFVGTVVHTKLQEGYYGSQYKMIVKVQGEGGVWKVWTTIPAKLLDSVPNSKSLRGAEVEITARLQAGDDPHFCFAKRPDGKLLKLPQAQEVQEERA